MKYYETEMILDEGPLVLDYANTLDWHASAAPIENLIDYPTLVKWALDKKILPAAEADHLLEAARQNPQKAEEILHEAIDLRESIYRILVSAIDQQQPDLADLQRIDNWSTRLLPLRTLVPEDGDLKWKWSTPEKMDQVLAPVVVSALNLITAPELHRVGQCADDRGCGWLFLDLSKNRSRQWCSMEGCGNRAKAKRHYQKARQVA
jgi:predicted RNA-binding Zn ribbon-like protein